MPRFRANLRRLRRAAFRPMLIAAVVGLTVAALAGPAQAVGSSAGGTNRAAAATRCRTITDDWPAYDNAGLRLMSFTVYTYFCSNGSWVTYHSTWYGTNITKVGGAAGWSFDKVDPNEFHCFVGDGSHHSCSGNVEILQAHFTACVFKIGCIAHWSPTIEEDEFFNGAWVTFHDGVLHSSGG